MTPTPPPPRLSITADAGAQPGYAPISWMAVASLAVAIFFVVLLAVLGFVAFSRKEPLILPWLVIFPAIAVLLAFVARRQIRSSEGTRVGEWYANAGWWIGLVGGLGYFAYLFAVDFTIRNDANQAFVEFADHLQKADPDQPADPDFAAAMLLTIDPGVRGSADPKKPETMARFASELSAFRQTDVARICTRNKGAVTIHVHGLRDWQQKPTEISCSLGATLSCPEGDYELGIPMRATVDDKKRRWWQITPAQDGYVKSSSLTPYGRSVLSVEFSARRFGDELLNVLASNRQGVQGQFAFYGYVLPGATPAQGQEILETTRNRLPAVGGIVTVPLGDLVWKRYMVEHVLTTPGGGRPSPEASEQMFFLWNTPLRVLRAGGLLQGSTEVNPVIYVRPTEIEAHLPVELSIGGDAQSRTAAKGRLVLRCTADAAPKFFADLQAARKSAPTDPRTKVQSLDIDIPRLPWRATRLESDLKPVTPPATGPGGGM